MVGVCLILMGCVMLIVPGPGLLTLLMGLYITDFPGKASLAGRIKRSKFYRHYVINIESKLSSGKMKIKSIFKRKTE